MLDNLGDVEEVVQDAFINAYRGLPQLKDTASFSGWLAEIARNCARDRLRKQRLETVPIDEVGAHTLETSDSADAHLIRDEQIELIRRAMKTLSQKDREIARAYYLDGASYDELIRTHGLSYKAISFRLIARKADAHETFETSAQWGIRSSGNHTQKDFIRRIYSHENRNSSQNHCRGDSDHC